MESSKRHTNGSSGGEFGTCALCGARPLPPGEGIYPSDERRISRARRDREFLKEVTAGSDEEVKW